MIKLNIKNEKLKSQFSKCKVNCHGRPIFLFLVCVFNLCFFVFNFSYAIESSLGNLEREKINQALAIQGISAQELGFDKKWALDSVFRLQIITDLMDNPLKTPDYLDASVNKIDEIFSNNKVDNKITDLLKFLNQQIDISLPPREIHLLKKEIEKQESVIIKQYQTLPSELNQAITSILSSFYVGNIYLNQAIKNLTEDDINKILMTAPILWSDEDDTLQTLQKGALHREFNISVDTSQKVEIDTLLAIAQKVDRKALAIASCAVALGTDKAISVLSRQNDPAPFAKSHKDKLKTFDMSSLQPDKRCGADTVQKIEGAVVFYEETEWGKIVIGSEDDNTYEGDYAVIIDLGGDDIYKGRIGSGIGILSYPFSVLIDLKGNDFYTPQEKFFNLGSGLLGCGITVDLQGNDFYNTYNNCLGTGFFGAGVVIDNDGDDYYSTGYFSQGAGIFGIGALIDIQGNDTYRGYEYCQGFSSTWGYGLLVDLEGNDLYYAGGKYLHKPLLPDDFRSLSQGFSIGFRPVASGGIAMLYDKQGQDFYNAGVFGQGTSYWYALGMLYDGEGNDFYNATEYAQGAGIHLAVGILIDRSGDDHYFSRLGPAQGEGHDFSVGILIDKKGSDSYLTSGGQGIGLTNSFGLLIDNEGNDIYTTKEKNFGQGIANWSRGFGGIGVFLDLQGEDIYPRESSADNTSNWTQTVFGMGIDVKGKERDIEAEIQEEPDTVKLKTALIEDVFKEASLWEVGSAKKRVKAGRADLLNRGQEAIKYINEKKMNTKDGLELRAIEELAKALPDSFKPILYQALYDKDRWTKSNAAYLLGKIKAIDAIDSLLLAYQQNRIRARSMIGAFEDIDDSTVVPIIIPYLKDKEEPTRIASARTLAKLKDSRAIPELYNALSDKFFTVRMAAETALVAIGESSLEYLMTRSNDPKIIGILGVLGTKLDTIQDQTKQTEIQNIIIPYLDNKDASLRLRAVIALAQFNNSNIKMLLKEKMTSETNEFMLTKYKEVLK